VVHPTHNTTRLLLLVVGAVLGQDNHLVHPRPHRLGLLLGRLDGAVRQQLCGESPQQGLALVSRPPHAVDLAAVPHHGPLAPVVNPQSCCAVWRGREGTVSAWPKSAPGQNPRAPQAPTRQPRPAGRVPMPAPSGSASSSRAGDAARVTHLLTACRGRQPSGACRPPKTPAAAPLPALRFVGAAQEAQPSC
jgi:hypothetical protein